jgi:hypothetical protein
LDFFEWLIASDSRWRTAHFLSKNDFKAVASLLCQEANILLVALITIKARESLMKGPFQQSEKNTVHSSFYETFPLLIMVTLDVDIIIKSKVDYFVDIQSDSVYIIV